MNLLDCSVAYFHTVPEVLKLRPTALSVALDVHCGKTEQAPERLKPQLGELGQPVNPSPKSFMLPAKLDYERLSYAEKKILIACYAECKHSRTPFRVTLTREKLASLSRLSLPHARKALRELQARRLVHVKQLWRKGIQISLLDPEHHSGAALYWIATFNRDRLESIPAFQWYRVLLHDDHIPRDTRREWDARETDYVLDSCPFCGSRKTFRITLILNERSSGYDKDAWYCHRCKRGGDHKRLWGLLHFHIDNPNWREALMRREVYEHVN